MSAKTDASNKKSKKKRMEKRSLMIHSRKTKREAMTDGKKLLLKQSGICTKIKLSIVMVC